MGTSVYPGALDNFAEASPPYLADDDTTGRDHPARHDDMEAAMEAVQGELGTDPAGGAATVKARLDAADSTVASKAPLDSPAFTGTVNFTGTSIIGLPAAGKILQVVRATDSTNRTTNSTSFVDVTGMSVTITPQKSDSAILVIATGSGFVYETAVTFRGDVAITDASDNGVSGASFYRFGLQNVTSAGPNTGVQFPLFMMGYATPATTSATTYKLRFRVGASGETIELNNSTYTVGQMYAIEVSA